MGFALLQADSRAGCLDLSGPPESPCPSSVSPWRPAVALTPIHASFYIQTAPSRPQWAFGTPAARRARAPPPAGISPILPSVFSLAPPYPAGTPFKLRVRELTLVRSPRNQVHSQASAGHWSSPFSHLLGEAASRLLPEASTVSAKATLAPAPVKHLDSIPRQEQVVLEAQGRG